MASYIPMNEDERREMMDTIGISSLDEMYVNIPADMRVKKLDLKTSVSPLFFAEQALIGITYQL